jgi:hypothetical protein
MVSSAVNLGGAGAPFVATAVTGDVALAAVVLFTAAEVMGRAPLTDFITVAGLGRAAGIASSDSGTEAADANAKAACLNSTDFKFPRVAMIQSVSPKRVRLLILRNPRFILQRAKKQAALHEVRPLPSPKVLKGREMSSVAACEFQQGPMNKFQLRDLVPKWNGM